jgi:hypothetical protein
MGGVSRFLISVSRESWVWNDWYSMGVVVGHMGSTLVGICSHHCEHTNLIYEVYVLFLPV